MLHEIAVEKETLTLIRRLHRDPELSQMHLGGTAALTLWLGHVRSENIALYSVSAFDVRQLLEYLEREYRFAMEYQSPDSLRGFISGVFVDIFAHGHPLVKEIVSIDGIRLYSPEDIAAMKIRDIYSDGYRISDFIDLVFLLDKFTLTEMLSFYRIKYDRDSTLQALKSLVYFDDLYPNARWPELLMKKKMTLAGIKNALSTAVKETVGIGMIG